MRNFKHGGISRIAEGRGCAHLRGFSDPNQKVGWWMFVSVLAGNNELDERNLTEMYNL